MAAGVLLGACCVLVGIFYFISRDMCGNDVVREVVSPDGKQKVVVFERSCGATTGFSTQMSIVQARKKLDNEGGNAFVADSSHGAVEVNSRGVIDADVHWIDNNTVEISYPVGARIFRNNSQVGSVSVRYTAK